MTDLEKTEQAVTLIIKEFGRATDMYSPMHSAHEGYATVLEELDELWDEIKKKPAARVNERMLDEAVQVGAMALRFIVDVCMKGK